MKCHIRWLIRRDLSEILEIEKQKKDYIWGEKLFLKYLRLRNCIGMVAEHEEEVLGYFVYILRKDKIIVENFGIKYIDRELEVQMVEKLKNKLSGNRNKLVFVTNNEELLSILRKTEFTIKEREINPFYNEEEFTAIYEGKTI